MTKKIKKQKSDFFLNKLILIIIVSSIILAFIFIAYKLTPQKPLIYKGITPCADCPGIEETITLNPNKTFTDTNIYLDRNTQYTDKGTWQIIKGTKTDQNATVYQLTGEQGNKRYYLLQDNKIVPLDADLGEIPVPYNAPLLKQ